MKKDFRKKVIEYRNNKDTDFISTNSQKITEKLLSMKCIKDASTIMLYLDFNNEVKTDQLITKLISLRKTVAAPVTIKDERKLIPFKITNLKDGINIGAYGIREPKKDPYNELNVEDINFYTPSNPNPNEQIITDNISVEYSNRGGWQSGEKYVSQIYIDIKNNANVDFSYWELIIKRPPNSSIKSLWGASFVEKDDTIIITGENGNNSFYSSNSKSIGMQIEVEDANTQLETLKVFGKGIVE